MTTARRANPSKRLTNLSRTMPVPLLITMAPKSGNQPCVRRGLTWLLLIVKTKQALAETRTTAARIKGMGVLITRIRTDDIMPMKHKVTRSPRQDATGGAMLSGNLCYRRSRDTGCSLTWIAAKAPADND